ncbi:hypothetical protein [Acinetobacter boissieri]|uniref:Uncharacterized protein n=1 Tax=Acinetobacter boissieri TaxID=1219383 RepID=A0A1G6HX62_9GAMM|nr:hypothetical protein [Acinetobacter boissieri]SDB98738.1 hypothetical protein SAMN05421733_10789 [Acinetobacter boissieri]
MSNFVSNEDQLNVALENNQQTIEVRGSFANDVARRKNIMPSMVKNVLLGMIISVIAMIYSGIEFATILIVTSTTVVFILGILFLITRSSEFKKINQDYIIKDKSTDYLLLKRK